MDALAPLLDATAWRDLFVAHPAIWMGFTAALGAIMASFGGVVVVRLPRMIGWINPADALNGATEEACCAGCGTPLWATAEAAAAASAAGGNASLMTRSHCDACGVPLGPLALVPVLGWLLHRGHCARCGARVSWAYPAAEAATALVSAALAVHFGPGLEAALALGVLWVCVVLAWMDWREALLPDSITVPLLCVGLLASPFASDPLARIQGAVACLVAIWASFLVTGRAKGVDTMSLGDLALAFAAGAWIGLPAAPAWLAISAAVYIVLALPRRLRGLTWTPMGPALCAGLLACLWFGEALHVG